MASLNIFQLSIITTFLIASVVLPLANASAYQCLTLKGEQLDIIDARQMLNTEQNILNCMMLSLEKGRIGQTKSIIDLYGEQYQHRLVTILQNQLQRLQLIQKQVIQGQSNCPPVVKWGQNQTHLFISMKMSHRWDSPPCLNTQSQNSSLVNSHFEYINVCVVSHHKVTFNLSIDFFYPVKQQNSNVIKDGVGTYSTIIEKQEDKIWPFLDKTEVYHPIWEQIAERYSSVHKEYVNLVQSIVKERKSKPVQLEESPSEKKQKGQKKGTLGTTLEDILVQTAVQEAIEKEKLQSEQKQQVKQQQQL